MMKAYHEQRPLLNAENSPWHQGYNRVSLPPVVFVLLLALSVTRSVYAALLPQEDDNAILRVVNESEETICGVYISPITTDSWGDDWLNEGETLLSSNTISFNLPPGDYDILLTDCAHSQLLNQRSIFITNFYELRLTNSEVCQSLNQEGIALYHQAMYFDAIEKFNKALICYREAKIRKGEETALGNLGFIHSCLGQYKEALNYSLQALAIQREIGDRAGEGSVLNNIGGIYDSLGQYGEALDTYQQSLAIVREIGDRMWESGSLNNIGLVYYRLGQYDEALDYYQQALAISRDIGNHLCESNTLNNLGLTYLHLEQYGEALDYYQQALAISREIGDWAGEGRTLNNIGGIYTRLGRHTEALEICRQALAILREVGDQEGEGTTINNLGFIHEHLGQYVEAMDYYQTALTLRRKLGDQAGEGVSLNNIGFTYQYQNQPEQASRYYEQAITIFESIRATVGSETGRASFIAQYTDLYNRAISLYYTQSQEGEAFHTTERGRARAFLDTMATGYIRLSDNNAADLLAHEQATYNTRLVAQTILAKAYAQQPIDATLIADLEDQLVAAEEEYASALATIEARSDQLAALVPGRNAVLDLAQVQSYLDEHTMLISFWVLEEQTLAFIINHDSLHTVALEVSRSNLSAQITDFRNFANTQVAHPESAKSLYNILIAPLKDHLTTSHLLIVPHNVLHYLPFAALTDGERYLVDDYTLAYLPNASVLQFLSSDIERDQDTPLILGNPTTGDFDTTASLATERDQLSDLPFAEQEAQAIAALYDTTAFIKDTATESRVREQVSEHSILHLAAHGKYNPVAPLNSLIALAPGGDHDGWLTVGEVYGLDLHQTDLVVLSACESHLGDLNAGDELVGLTRAFFFAGTPTVVASLWTVDDQATALLMERFYTHLRARMGKAVALRQAQIDIRAEYPNPYYWAAFVLSGDAGEPTSVSSETLIPTNGTTSGGGLCMGATLLLMLLAVVWVWRRS